MTQVGEREPNESGLGLLAHGAASVTFVEEVRAVGPRGADDARREYRAATASLEMRDAAAALDAAPLSRVEFTSELAGASVRQLRRRDGTFGRHYDGREARESLLAYVADPLDLGRLLPKEATTLGGEWDVPLDALVTVLAPVAELGWRAPEEGTDLQLVRSFQQGLGGNVHLGFGGALAGQARGQVFELGVSGKERLATLRVTFELTLTADHTDLARRRALENEREQGVEVLAATSTRRLVGVVDLVWSVEGERPVSATVAADEAMAMSIRVQPEEGEAATQTVEFAGRCALSLTAAPVPLESSVAPRDGK